MKLTASLLIAIGLTAANAAAAETANGYPTKQIRMVVPWAAGNLTDTIARMLSDRLGKSIGQPVWVENKGGASGIVGMEALARSAPDGYTIGISAIGPLAMNPGLYAKLPYNSTRDFTPIAMLWSGPMVILVPMDSPYKTLTDLVAKSKQTPNGIDYASPGKGTLQNITAELLKSESGAHLNHIAYRGSSQAVAGALGGQVPVLVETLSVALPHIKAAKLRPLAVSTANRAKLLPDVPTIAEAGYPKVVTDGWICLIAPAGLPEPIQAKLNAEVRKVLSTDEARQWAENQGGWLDVSSPAELKTYIAAEVTRLGAIIHNAGISAD